MENQQQRGNRGGWQPLLTGKEQAAALAVVSTIAKALNAHAVAAGYHHDLALFFAYLHLAVEYGQADGSDRARARHLLEQAIDQIAMAPMGVGLYGGLAGVGWSLTHVSRLLGEDAEESNTVIDEVLQEAVAQSPWPGDYDLIGGLVGIGVYALERLPNALAVATLEHIVDRLDELAVTLPSGVTWFTPPERLPAHQRTICPNGYYNLGVAHGVPGVIAWLGRVYAAGVAVSKARRLLHGAVPWLLAQEIGAEQEVGFPSWVAPTAGTGSLAQTATKPAKVARSAWCYGDPGIAAALLSAARRVNEPDWEAAALAIAQRAACRAMEQAAVQDACVCHGAAGLGHLFNRLYQATGDPLMGAAAHSWFARTLVMQQPGQGIAGFCNWQPGDAWVADPGFLSGAAGIALALLAATTSIEPAWDRLLLTDTPLLPA
jgi:lantibiotic modifying enzyme